MGVDLTRRRFRLIVLGGEALVDADAMSLLPPLERLLRAGVPVVVLPRTEEDGAAAFRLRDAVSGPHCQLLIAGENAHPADARAPVAGTSALVSAAPTATARSAADWLRDAIALPRGIRPSDILALGPPDALQGEVGAMTTTPLAPSELAGIFAAQAALHPVELPGWIESAPEWHLVEAGYVPLREHELESLFAIGNGYVGSRASLAEGGPLSSPATFVAGVFDHPPRDKGAADPVPELLTLPDWARLAGTLDGDVLRIDEGEILSHHRVLDMRDGVLWREWRHRDPAGRISTVRGLRLASLADRHVLLQSVTLTPENYRGELQVESVLAGTRVAHASTGATVAFSIASVIETKAMFVRRAAEGVAVRATERPTETLTLEVAFDESARLDRIAVVHTTRDHPRPIESSARHLDRILDEKGVERILAEHRRAWRALWDDVDVTIEGDPEIQTALRFAIYHLLSAVHPDDEAVSVGARGLTGKGYKGHVFWDTEIFMLPFYALSRPAAARSVLMYRYRTLPAARARAEALGYRGALYAWESADTGEDVTPPFIAAPTGELLPVLAGAQEHHISADVAYGAWLYWHVSGDDAFLRDAGAEILIETARFWASRAEEGDDGRWHINQVIGPDEYHDSVDDNAYTNGMAQWNLEQAAAVVERCRSTSKEAFDDLAARLELAPEEPERWRDVARRMYTGFDPETGLFEQFRGYFECEDIDLSAHEPRELPIDLMLGPERVQGSQILKQPDVLMLLWLFRDRYSREVHEANFRYYEPRTAHGSSLSPPIHAALAARLGDSALTLRYLRQTAEIDLANNMGNAAGGVHMAALGGLWQAAVLGVAGLRLEDEPTLDARLPPAWRAIRLGVCWRGEKVRLAATQREVRS